MQLFIDSADPKQIKTAWDWGIIDGVTTNPSLAAKVGRPYSQIVDEIFKVVQGPVSLEVIAEDEQGMLDQAYRLAKINPNAVIKVPCTWAGLKVSKQLVSEGIKVNVTLVFSANQALLVAKTGASYCSPFMGRLNDVNENSGEEVIAQIRQVYDMYGFETQILAASVRDVNYVTQAALLGVDIATVPFDVLEELVKHKLTDQGIERFNKDWEEAGLELPA